MSNITEKRLCYIVATNYGIMVKSRVERKTMVTQTYFRNPCILTLEPIPLHKFIIMLSFQGCQEITLVMLIGI